MTASAPDPRQGSLFSGFYTVPRAPRLAPGSLNIEADLARTLSEAIKASPASRTAIAGRMSEYLGLKVSNHMLDAWTSTAHRQHRFPCGFMPAFEAATEVQTLYPFMASANGGLYLHQEQALDAELGQLRRARRELYQREKLLLTLRARP